MNSQRGVYRGEATGELKMGQKGSKAPSILRTLKPLATPVFYRHAMNKAFIYYTHLPKTTHKELCELYILIIMVVWNIKIVHSEGLTINHNDYALFN